MPNKYTEKLGGNRIIKNFSKGLSNSAYLYPGDYCELLKSLKDNRKQDEVITFQFRMNLFSEEYRWYEGMLMKKKESIMNYKRMYN